MTEPSEKSASLHSVLDTALASLDLTLEDELAYYRQQRAQLALPPQAELDVESPAIETKVESAEIESITEARSNDSVPEVESETETQTSLSDAPPEVVSAVDLDEALAEDVELPNDSGAMDPETLPDAALVSEPDASALITTGELIATADNTGMIEIETPSDAALDSETAEALNAPSEPPPDFPKSYENYLDPSIEDYLESSEALLKHLEESKTDNQPKSTPKRRSNLSGILLLIFGVLGIGGGVFWGLRQQQPKRRQPSSSPSVAPVAPSPSVSPSPSFRLPTTAPSLPNETPLPIPTASSIPLEPPNGAPTSSPSPSPPVSAEPTTTP